MVAHPVTQVMASWLQLEILDLSKVPWTCWGCSNTSSGLELRMVKELDLSQALGMFERRKTGSLCLCMHRWGVGGLNLGQTQS